MKSRECYLCHKKGHIAKARRSKKQGDFKNGSEATGTVVYRDSLVGVINMD